MKIVNKENELFKKTFDQKIETLNSELKRIETNSKSDLLEKVKDTENNITKVLKDNNANLETKTKNLETTINNVESKIAIEVANIKKEMNQLDSRMKNDLDNKFKQLGDESSKINSDYKKIIDDLSTKFDLQQKSIGNLIEKDKEMYNQLIDTKNKIS